MKTRFAAIAVLAVFVVLVSSSAVVLTSDSDAATMDYSKYYYEQLDDGQKEIYDAFYDQITGDATPSGDTFIYTVNLTDIYERSESKLKSDVATAWAACRLDDPYAYWTWTKDIGVPTTEVVKTGTDIKITISVDQEYSTVFEQIDTIKQNISALTTKGSNESKRVDKINDVLTGSEFKYDESGSSNVYPLVSGEGPYTLSAEGFAAVFKALCDTESADGVKVGCMQVYGTLADGSTSTVYAWNIVCVEEQFYAVDVATNNDSGDDDAWLCVGRLSTYDGNAFATVHLSFMFNTPTGLSDSFGNFESELLANGGYDWPEEKGIMVWLTNNAAWIVIGIICAVLALVLVHIGLKEAKS